MATKGKSSAGTSLLEIDTSAIALREAEVALESDETIINRLNERFEILNEMARAVKAGNVKALIVVGPAGVGKSFGVEAVLQKDDLFNTLAAKKPKFEIVKGNMSALGLYAKLYEYSDAGKVVVFDDCDAVLTDELSLNILKGALDSSARRWISWNTDSRMLNREGIPDRFEFKGSAIFITNIKFDTVKSKRLKGHLAALESRCHYIDLEMDTKREKLMRIKQVVDAGMLDAYEFNEPEVAKDELLAFVNTNQDMMRELSLRCVLKLADLRKSFPGSWTSMAKTTLMHK